jgi:cytochrome c oxidase subunit 2
MDPADYEAWLRTGNTRETLARRGEKLFTLHGCFGCHSENGSVRAPLLEGIYGKPVAIQRPRAGTSFNKMTRDQMNQVLAAVPATTVLADDRYIHDSIVLPEQEIAAGYLPVMPSFRNRLTEEEIMQLVAYIRSLSVRDEAAARRVRDVPGRTLSAEEYRTRTGFVPENVGTPAGSGAPRSAPQQGSTAGGSAGRNNGRTTR